MSKSESPRRTRLLASGLLVLTFAVGAIAGAAADRSLKAGQPNVRDTRRQGGSQEFGRRPRRIPSIFLDTTVFTRIGANAEQRQKIDAILMRRDSAANALYAQIKPGMDSMIKETRGEIKAQLSAEQLEKLDQIMKQQRERWRQSRERHQENKPRP